jgi:hypothetical protein
VVAPDDRRSALISRILSQALYSRTALNPSWPVFLMIFYIGVFATLAWQSYGGAAREAIANWSPRLAWLAPPAASAGGSPDQIVAITRDLAVVRQSVDELAANVSKLQMLQQEGQS